MLFLLASLTGTKRAEGLPQHQHLCNDGGQSRPRAALREDKDPAPGHCPPQQGGLACLPLTDCPCRKERSLGISSCWAIPLSFVIHLE